jgi:hypothetical protein
MKRNSNNNLDDFKDEDDIVGDDDFKHKIVGSRMMVLDIGVNSSIEEISKTIKTMIMCLVIRNLLNWKLLVFKVKIISRFIWSGKGDGLIYSKIKLLCESFILLLVSHGTFSISYQRSIVLWCSS